MGSFGLGLGLTYGSNRGAGTGAAASLLGNEWYGFALDFTDNSYAIQRAASDAETLLGTGPYSTENGLGLSFTDNSYAVRS